MLGSIKKLEVLLTMKLLKKQVHDYWNKASCGVEHTDQRKFSRKYFQEIESFRYRIEPEIFSFAQFTRYHGKKILEVGIGAGTDCIQWARAGADVYGVDLTQEAIDNVSRRFDLYWLQAKELTVADAENLPYQDASFDLVYSWGVIHHSPDTVKCFQEIIRVTKPGGAIKIMVYNRRSLFACYRWILAGLLKGKPFRSISSVLFTDQESAGTKAYTKREIKNILREYPVVIKDITAPVTNHDLLYYKSRPFRWLAYVAACVLGWKSSGWFMMISLKKQCD